MVDPAQISLASKVLTSSFKPIVKRSRVTPKSASRERVSLLVNP
ncbi:Uncharacterised protein [Vibrio cholerae]|uniref:Uncharacterized protein n=1 Tax=Vibrio cholerae TaxID=666 RepID=A0A655QC34_VIBCL|nr:Uncharacterised protein [Vibrio cholerae]CSB03296.1 Uncharacterised protein [Vibrio cholerae]